MISWYIGEKTVEECRYQQVKQEPFENMKILESNSNFQSIEMEGNHGYLNSKKLKFPRTSC